MLNFKQMCLFIESLPDINEIVKEMGMNTEDAAELILNFIGYNNRIVDHMIEQRERKLFYYLETQGFMESTSEDVVIAPGKYWRIHYWNLKEDRVLSFLKRIHKVKILNEKETYEAISSDLWKRSGK